MAEDEKGAKTAEAQEDRILDDELHSADQMRATAKWLATALAAIPSLALITGLVPKPGEAGFDTGLLILGLLLLGIGAGLALALLGHVQSPAAVTDTELATVTLNRIPGAPPFIGNGGTRADSLLAEMNATRSDVAAAEAMVTRATVASKFAEAEAAMLSGEAVELEEIAKRDGATKEQMASAARARAKADAAKARATQAAAMLAAQQTASAVWTLQFQRLGALRGKAILIKAADVIRGRFQRAIVGAPIGLAIATAGLFVLVLSVKTGAADKDKDASATGGFDTVLVRLTTNEQARLALGCSAPQVNALRVEDSDGALKLVTLPNAECPNAVAFEFPVSGFNGAYGSIEVVKPIPAPSPGPSNSPMPSTTPGTSSAAPAS